MLKTAVVVIGCCGAQAPSSRASIGNTVNQVTDPTTTAAENMFRFEPNFVRLSPGDELVFLNSRGEHTVHSVPELWPDGAEPVSIAHKDEAVVHFAQEGFYGFRCQRHGQYGMVMLVVVGRPGSAEDLRPIVESMRAERRERTGFVDLLDRYDRA